jgi:hypothetical protein
MKTAIELVRSGRTSCAMKYTASIVVFTYSILGILLYCLYLGRPQ